MKHYYQTNNHGCVQAATAMLLSHYGIEKTPADIEAEVPVRSWPGKGEPAGTPNMDVAAYLCRLRLDVEIISFDTWVTDLAWQGKDTAFIRERLQAASRQLTAEPIGREGTELYIESYLDYIDAGGRVSVRAYPSSALLRELLQGGPVMACVAYSTLRGEGKSVNEDEVRQSHPDDIKGGSANHNIVISREVDNEAGTMFEIYDPWKVPGVHLVGSDQLVAAIATSQMECDNMVVVVR